MNSCCDITIFRFRILTITREYAFLDIRGNGTKNNRFHRTLISADLDADNYNIPETGTVLVMLTMNDRLVDEHSVERGVKPIRFQSVPREHKRIVISDKVARFF